jgi:hypothetical protein
MQEQVAARESLEQMVRCNNFVDCPDVREPSVEYPYTAGEQLDPFCFTVRRVFNGSQTCSPAPGDISGDYVQIRWIIDPAASVEWTSTRNRAFFNLTSSQVRPRVLAPLADAPLEYEARSGCPLAPYRSPAGHRAEDAGDACCGHAGSAPATRL